VFDHELFKIRDSKAKATIIAMLKAAPEEFWFAPSAFSGKYHDPIEFNMGGQVLHTKRVFRSLMILIDALAKELNDEEMDELMCAALIHDTLAGSTGSSDHVSQYRDYYGEKLPDGIKDLEWWEGICDTAEHHMGRWSPNNHPDLYPKWYSGDEGGCPAYDWLVHLADMQATKANGMPILKEADYNIR
jgi:hypothetical protein